MTEFDRITTAACLAGMLSSPTRLRLLKLVEEEELCVCELACMLGISQPATSQHLAKLRRAGLVRERREGPMALYRAADVAAVFGRAIAAVLDRPAAELPELAECLGRREAARARRPAPVGPVRGAPEEASL